MLSSSTIVHAKISVTSAKPRLLAMVAALAMTALGSGVAGAATPEDDDGVDGLPLGSDGFYASLGLGLERVDGATKPDQEFAVGLSFKRNFLLGVESGQQRGTRPQATQDPEHRGLSASYFGIVGAYLYKPVDVIYLKSGVLVGGSWASLGDATGSGSDRKRAPMHGYFTAEPRFEVGTPIGKYVRVGLRVGYRYLAGGTLDGVEAADLSTGTFSLVVDAGLL